MGWLGVKVADDAGPLVGKTFVGGVIDSYEVGGQNWGAISYGRPNAAAAYDLAVSPSPRTVEAFVVTVSVLGRSNVHCGFVTVL